MSVKVEFTGGDSQQQQQHTKETEKEEEERQQIDIKHRLQVGDVEEGGQQQQINREEERQEEQLTEGIHKRQRKKQQHTKDGEIEEQQQQQIEKEQRRRQHFWQDIHQYTAPDRRLMQEEQQHHQRKDEKQHQHRWRLLRRAQQREEERQNLLTRSYVFIQQQKWRTKRSLQEFASRGKVVRGERKKRKVKETLPAKAAQFLLEARRAGKTWRCICGSLLTARQGDGSARDGVSPQKAETETGAAPATSPFRGPATPSAHGKFFPAKVPVMAAAVEEKEASAGAATGAALPAAEETPVGAAAGDKVLPAAAAGEVSATAGAAPAAAAADKRPAALRGREASAGAGAGAASATAAAAGGTGDVSAIAGIWKAAAARAELAATQRSATSGTTPTSVGTLLATSNREDMTSVMTSVGPSTGKRREAAKEEGVDDKRKTGEKAAGASIGSGDETRGPSWAKRLSTKCEDSIVRNINGRRSTSDDVRAAAEAKRRGKDEVTLLAQTVSFIEKEMLSRRIIVIPIAKKSIPEDTTVKDHSKNYSGLSPTGSSNNMHNSNNTYSHSGSSKHNGNSNAHSSSNIHSNGNVHSMDGNMYNSSNAYASSSIYTSTYRNNNMQSNSKSSERGCGSGKGNSSDVRNTKEERKTEKKSAAIDSDTARLHSIINTILTSAEVKERKKPMMLQARILFYSANKSTLLRSTPTDLAEELLRRGLARLDTTAFPLVTAARSHPSASCNSSSSPSSSSHTSSSFPSAASRCVPRNSATLPLGHVAAAAAGRVVAASRFTAAAVAAAAAAATVIKRLAAGRSARERDRSRRSSKTGVGERVAAFFKRRAEEKRYYKVRNSLSFAHLLLQQTDPTV